jgi:DNA gyrase/topoisomerase IV subunit B
MYQKKTPLEHILLRPDTYIGTTEMNQASLWVLDPDSTKFVNRPVNIVPGLYKIVDEIIVNAADNKVNGLFCFSCGSTQRNPRLIGSPEHAPVDSRPHHGYNQD